MNIKPAAKNIFAKLRPPEEKIGSIHLPQQASNRTGPVFCTVTAVGPNVGSIKVGMELALYPGKAVLIDHNEAIVVFLEDFEKTIIGSI